MKTAVKSPESAGYRHGLGMFLTETPLAAAPKHFFRLLFPRNHHFPALRSVSLALSGASRRKQIPSSLPPVGLELMLLGFFFSVFIMPLSSVAGTAYFISVTGKDSNNGRSIATPFESVGKGVKMAKAGDSIYVLGGTYQLLESINPTTSGTAKCPITLSNFDRQKVIFDGKTIQPGGNGKILRFSGISFWNIAGLELRNAPGAGIAFINGSNNLNASDLIIHDNQYGFEINSSNHNMITRCDSFNNYDSSSSGGDADGFECKQGASHNTYSDCRSWNNSDDGWDFWGCGSGNTVESCKAWKNGLNYAGSRYGKGDGVGFKLGGHYAGGSSGGVIVMKSVAWDNFASGFDSNCASRPLALANCTAYNNVKCGDQASYGNYHLSGPIAHVVKNCISSGGGGQMFGAKVVAAHNTWNMGIIDAKFESVNSTEDSFLHLSSMSPCIDVGVKVGVAYSGKAPDLGAYESAPGAPRSGDSGSSSD